ncbi:hypothetical protein KR222_003436 [Zaprionus bogoriensis]|nr:hypothetical protein KR222_003436 [Zaprionus bogoriensis]
MNCLATFLKCSQILTDPTAELEIDELSEAIAEKCEKFLRRKNSTAKRRFECIDKYTRNEIVMMDELIPSPNVDHFLEVAIDETLGDIHF